MNTKLTYKTYAALVIFSIFPILLFTNLNSNDIFEAQKEYARHPPIAQKFWIQKDREAKGKTILMVEFKSDYPMPYLLRLNYLGETIKLQDTGSYPDAKKKDGIYSTQLNVNPDLLAKDLAYKYKQTAKRGYYVKYKGHTAYTIPVEDDFAFDLATFRKYIPVSIEPDITSEECDQDLKKEKSLFITDLSVVEDEARTYKLVTYNITNCDANGDNCDITPAYNNNSELVTAGTPLGEWTFGNLMQNMAGGPAVNNADVPRVRNFLKEWVISLYRDYQYNGEHSLNDITGGIPEETRLSRERGVFYHLIEPWLTRTFGAYVVDGNYTFDNWESYWDGIDTKTKLENLLINAPFKLTAIVNRVDLRENMLYSSNIHSGEVRFIFTLIETITGGDEGEITANNLINNERHPTSMLGKPPHHINQSGITGGGDGIGAVHLDWQGMNVILEYGIPFTKFCDLKKYMKDWYDLSLLDFDNTYLNKLEDLTKAVTDANVMPNQPNGSAISQVRTNDRLFHLLADGTRSNNSWSPIKWELRQFELETSPTNGNYSYLTNAPVTNTPLKRTNYAPNTERLNIPTTDRSVIDWVFGNAGTSHINTILNGNHNLPSNLLSPTAIVDDNLTHHYGINWEANSYTYSTTAVESKNIQHQISLNSCQGCHNNETKTLFTMVRPLGYGQEANYWDTSPTEVTGNIDTRILAYTPPPNGSNKGQTYDNNSNTDVENYWPSTELAGNNVTIPVVSPFITGRNHINGSYEDDEFDPLIDIFSDNEIEGLFYVNNPNNQSNGAANSGPYPNNQDSKFGFNELKRRKTHFCNLVDGISCQNTPWGPPIGGIDYVNNAYRLFREIAFVPFPEKSH